MTTFQILESTVTGLTVNATEPIDNYGRKIWQNSGVVGKAVRDSFDLSPAGLLYHTVTQSTNPAIGDIYNIAGKTNLGVSVESRITEVETVGKLLLGAAVIAGGYLLYEGYQHKSEIFSGLTNIAQKGINIATAGIRAPAIAASEII